MTSQRFKECFGDLPIATQENIRKHINAIKSVINKDYGEKHPESESNLLNYENR